MFCRKCGKELAEDAIFCGSCGQRILDENVANTNRIVERPMQIAKDSMQIEKVKKLFRNLGGLLNIVILLCIIGAAIVLLFVMSDEQQILGNLQIKDGNGKVLLTSADVEAAELSKQTGALGEECYAVVLHFNEKGTEKFYKVTSELLEEPMYIYVNNNLIGAPIVNGVIYDGVVSIAQYENYQEASTLLDEICGTAKNESEKKLFGNSEMNINGNTHANLKNGGWVTEQGEWNYYAIENTILGENVVTGKKEIVLGATENYDSSVICNLHVMGDWIYFSKKEKGGIYRIRLDGTDFGSYVGVSNWDTYDGNVYGIAYETVTASTQKKMLVQIDWENGTYEEQFEIGEELEFIGIEDGYAYFTSIEETNLSPITREYTYSYLQVNLSGDSQRQCTWTDEYDYEKVSSVGVPYIKDGKIYVLYRYQDAIISNNITYEILSCNFETEEINFTQIPTLSGTWNFYGDRMLFGRDGISSVGLDGTQSMVIVDTPYENSLCVAHDEIFYRCNGMYCKVNEDGSGWEQILVEEFWTE